MDKDDLGNVSVSSNIVVHFTLEGLVEANINRLDKPRAAGRDEINLHVKGLDGIDNHPHLMDPKLVQEEDGNDPQWRRCNVGGTWAKPSELALPGYVFPPTWPGLRNS